MKRALSTILEDKFDRLITTNAGSTLDVALSQLVEHNVGSVLVMEEDYLVGIITERDILRAMAMRKDINTTPVSEVMTVRVIVALDSDDISYTMNIMTENRVRHMPVFRDDQVVGVVSLGDVVNAVRIEDEEEIRYLQEYIAGR